MKIKSLFISDLHLGCKKNRSKDALNVLTNYEYENLFLLGDIIDIKALSHEWLWDDTENKIWETIIKKAENFRTIMIPGNHERGFFDNISTFENMLVCGGYPYRSKEKIIYLTHGHEFDENLESNHWPRSLINVAYNGVSEFNLKICSQLKKLIRKTPGYLDSFKANAIDYAKQRGYNSIMCGHTHQQEFVDGDIEYYNTGDFREDATFITEDFEGNLNLRSI